MEADLSPFSGRVIQAAFFVPLSGSVGDGSGVSVSQPDHKGASFMQKTFATIHLPIVSITA